MPDLLTIAGSVLDIANAMKNTELILAMTELNKEAGTLLAENQNLKEQIKMLQDEKENPLIFREGLYYAADDMDNRYPYCTACYDASKQRIHLIKHSLKCPKCNADYTEPSGPFFKTSNIHPTARDIMRGYL